MKLSYSIPLQTVSFELTPAEAVEIKNDVKERIKDLFCEVVFTGISNSYPRMVKKLKEQIPDKGIF